MFTEFQGAEPSKLYLEGEFEVSVDVTLADQSGVKPQQDLSGETTVKLVGKEYSLIPVVGQPNTYSLSLADGKMSFFDDFLVGLTGSWGAELLIEDLVATISVGDLILNFDNPTGVLTISDYRAL